MNTKIKSENKGRIHKWLEHYKIFFEITSFTVIGCGAVFVSICQWRAMERQNELVKMQTNLAQQQAMPQFVISYKQIFNELTRKYDDDKILIENRGGYLRGFSAQGADFLRIESVNNKSIPVAYTNLTLPIEGYFFGNCVYATSGTGNLCELEGHNNNARFIDFQRQINDLGKADMNIFNLYLEHYVQLSYNDITGVRHQEYYKVTPIYGGNLFPKNEGEALFKSSEAALLNRSLLEFDLIIQSPKTFYEKFRAKSAVKM